MHQFENIPHPHCSLLFVTANPAKSQMLFPETVLKMRINMMLVFLVIMMQTGNYSRTTSGYVFYSNIVCGLLWCGHKLAHVLSAKFR